MKKIVLIIFLWGLFFPALGLAEENNSGKPLLVSLHELVIHPEDYDKKLIKVYGEVDFDSHGYRALKVRGADGEIECVDLSIPKSIWEKRNKRNKLNGKKLYVIGKFIADDVPEGKVIVSWHCGDSMLYLKETISGKKY